MTDHPFAAALRAQVDFFVRGTASLTEADSAFVPAPGMFATAGQVAHAALTVDWFIAGGFSPSGFNLDFRAYEAEARSFTSLTAARAHFAAAYDRAIARLEATPLSEMQLPIALGPIMGGMPRLALAAALGDHTAHHRGALAVYARLLGRVPAMPYA